MYTNSIYKPHRFSKRHKAEPLQNCPYCKIPIITIKMNDGVEKRVDKRPVYYIPNPNGEYNLISPKGNIVRGVISSDGRKGYIEHCCRKL